MNEKFVKFEFQMQFFYIYYESNENMYILLVCIRFTFKKKFVSKHSHSTVRNFMGFEVQCFVPPKLDKTQGGPNGTFAGPREENLKEGKRILTKLKKKKNKFY